MSGIPDEKYVETVCRVGQRYNCCAYLGMTPKMFRCLKDSPMDRISIDARKDGKDWLSKGDNCDGYGKEQEKKYYLSLIPIDHIIRDFLGLLKEAQFFYKADFDPELIDLDKVLSPPDSNHGFRITSVVDKQGERLSVRDIGFGRPATAKDDEIHIRVNNMYNLAGGIYSFVLKPVNGKLKIVERKTIMRS